MGNIAVKASDPAATKIKVDGVEFTAEANGLFSIPEEIYDRVSDLNVIGSPLVLTTEQVVAMVTAGRSYAGMAFLWDDGLLGLPVWRNVANDAWVDSAGHAVAIELEPEE